MKRGEVWTASGGQDYASKPRPVVILQADQFDGIGSITVCPITTNPYQAQLFRLPVNPDPDNGLRSPSNLMVDKINTLPRSKLGVRIGRLADEDMLRLNRAIVVFLGISN